MFDDKIKKIIRIKKFGGKKDWDFDGVPNRKDCQPRNTMRQDYMGQSGKGREYVYPPKLEKAIREVKQREYSYWAHVLKNQGIIVLEIDVNALRDLELRRVLRILADSYGQSKKYFGGYPYERYVFKMK